jgi:ectoine hydroxylase-related dioxygenase (phytanoyl-CoA dioxygenase family)
VTRSSPPAEAFARQGFVHLPGFFAPAEVDDLRSAIEEAGRRREGASSLDDGGMTFYSLLFPLSPALQAFVSQPALLDLVCPLVDDDVWVRWDQAVVKRAGAPTFPWHQDNGYSLLRAEHLQAWVALTDAGADDGGLWVVPGSHATSLSHHHRGAHVAVDEEPSGGHAVDATAGDLILFSSRLVHRTTPNTSGRDRWTYVVEYLGVHQHDPFLAPPYFVASRDRQPAPHFTRWTPGRRSARQQLAYLPRRVQVRRAEGAWRRGL